jgi:hypothetical protein
MKIFASASKIVFLLIAFTACYGFVNGHLTENNFMILAGGVFAFYYANKGETSPDVPFAGK